MIVEYFTSIATIKFRTFDKIPDFLLMVQENKKTVSYILLMVVNQ